MIYKRYCRMKLVARFANGTRIYKDILAERYNTKESEFYRIERPHGGEYTIEGWTFAEVLNIALS